MTELKPEDVLFVGWGGADGVTHFRSVLPARMLGADLLVIGHDGKVVMNNACKSMHKVIIVQNCWHDWQLQHLRNMKAKGAIVIANIDDWVKAIARMEGKHAFANHFGKSKVINNHYRFMSEVDGVLVSTPWLQTRIRQFNDNIQLARNVIDLERFKVPPIERDAGVIIGWSGGTGHLGALRGVSEAISRVLTDRPQVRFVALGETVERFLGGHEGRVHTIEWQDLHTYPRDMVVMDIGIAPTESNDFYKAKSQLRFYEAGAARIPMVASPHYDEIRHGETGFIADTPDEWYEHLVHLVDDATRRDEVAMAAHQYIVEEVAGNARAKEWRDAISALSDTQMQEPDRSWQERLSAVSQADHQAYLGPTESAGPRTTGTSGLLAGPSLQLHRRALGPGTDAV